MAKRTSSGKPGRRGSRNTARLRTGVAPENRVGSEAIDVASTENATRAMRAGLRDSKTTTFQPSMPVDTQIIGVAVAVAALAAVYVDQSATLVGRVLGGAVYILAVTAAQVLYWDHVVYRLPATRRRFVRFRNRAPKPLMKIPIFVWLIIDYPILLFRSLLPRKGATFNEVNTEVGYLTLLGALFLGGATAFVHVMIAIVPPEYLRPAFRHFIK